MATFLNSQVLTLEPNDRANYTVVHTYAPPIKRGKVLSVLHDAKQGFYACVAEGGRYILLPFVGERYSDKDIMKRYLSHTYLKIDKNEKGVPTRICACVKGPGGMYRGKISTLPAYDGYGIGSVISKERLLLPIMQREVNEAYNERQAAENEKADCVKKIDDANKSKQGGDHAKEAALEIAKVREVQVLHIGECNQRIAQAHKKYELSADEYKKLQQTKAIGWEPTLPIDSRSVIKTEKRAFPSERLSHVILEQSQEGDTLQMVENEVRGLVNDLFLQDVSSYSFVTTEMLSVLSRRISKMIETSSKVALMGSFITLPKVRIMDPILVRQNGISEDLKANATHYNVISEAVLGAVFLGFGKYVEVNTGPATIEQITSTMSVFSFISQGAIPKVSKEFSDMNLWKVYLSWKEILETDPDSGYPIALRARELTDVLKNDNKMELPPEVGMLTQGAGSSTGGGTSG